LDLITPLDRDPRAFPRHTASSLVGHLIH
jgi:hypothetical protein